MQPYNCYCYRSLLLAVLCSKFTLVLLLNSTLLMGLPTSVNHFCPSRLSVHIWPMVIILPGFARPWLHLYYCSSTILATALTTTPTLLLMGLPLYYCSSTILATALTTTTPTLLLIWGYSSTTAPLLSCLLLLLLLLLLYY
jgi:hypothetical protein